MSQRCVHVDAVERRKNTPSEALCFKQKYYIEGSTVYDIVFASEIEASQGSRHGT